LWGVEEMDKKEIEQTPKHIFYSGGEAYFVCHREAITVEGLLKIMKELGVVEGGEGEAEKGKGELQKNGEENVGVDC